VCVCVCVPVSVYNFEHLCVTTVCEHTRACVCVCVCVCFGSHTYGSDMRFFTSVDSSNDGIDCVDKGKQGFVFVAPYFGNRPIICNSNPY